MRCTPSRPGSCCRRRGHGRRLWPATPAAKPWEFLRPARPVVTRRSLDLNGWTVVSVLPAEQAFLPLIDVRHKWLLIGLLTLAGLPA